MMHNEIQYKEAPPSAEDYFNLFETTGWNEKYRFSKDELDQAIHKSWYLISAYDGNRLAGFGRIISDGIHHALIVDLIVHPDYQRHGIGREILLKLTEQCKKYRIRDIQLFSAKGKSHFYKKAGYILRPEAAPGMEYRQI